MANADASIYEPYTPAMNLFCPHSNCYELGNVFFCHSSFMMHMKKDHGDNRPYHCKYCDGRYVDKGKLTVHIQKIHQKKINYDCDQCGKGFFNKTDWSDHCKVHHLDDLYRCNRCNALFGTKADLNRHKDKKHRKMKNFKCRICAMEFYAWTEYNDHCRAHNGIKYECNECGKTFEKLTDLSAHIRNVHKGVKKYQCDECKKSFFYKHDLRRHQRIHVGEKPFVCIECDKTFGTKHGLTRHILTHSGEKRYKCQKCFRRFADKYYCNKHQKKCK